MTYNIRYQNENPGEEWSIRKELVAEMIRFNKPDIFGVQEALKSQIDYLEESLPEFLWTGKGRDDGNMAGEYSAIFFSKKYLMLDTETFWLSPTPEIPSKAWDAALPRIVTMIKITDKTTKDTIVVLNTHFDHIGKIARENSAEIIVKKCQEITQKYPIILMGDFNVTDTSKVYSILNGSYFNNAQNISKFINYGSNDTFNGFKDDFTPKEKIDFIFVNDKVKVLHHAVIGDKFNNRFASDHMPVIVDFAIKRK